VFFALISIINRENIHFICQANASDLSPINSKLKQPAKFSIQASFGLSIVNKGAATKVRLTCQKNVDRKT